MADVFTLTPGVAECPWAEPRPVTPPPRAGAWLLAGLVLACLVPRLIVAWNLDVICQDGAFYVDLAREIEAGRYGTPEVRGGVGHYAYNVYPLVLAFVHPAGASWETVAKCWGLLCACLTMLTFYGWCRRQHGEAAAVWGGAILAAHPMLVRWSPEVARDSTFWLLFTLSLYLLWRAMGEVRLRWFLAAGVAMALAANTRFEGWFLYITLVVWLAWRGRVFRTARRKLALGASLIAVAYPLVLWSLMLAHGYVNWRLGGLGRLNLLLDWWQAPAAGGTAAASTGAATAAAAVHDATAGAALHASLGWRAAEWGNTIVRGFMYFFGAATLLGLWRARRIMLRPDILGLTCYCLPLLAGMWVQLGVTGLISRRYALSLVILSAPFAAHGLFFVARWCARPWRGRPQAVAYVAIGLLLLWSGYAWQHAIRHHDTGRENRAELGRWLKHEFGPGREFAGDARWRLVAFYAECSYRTFPSDAYGRTAVDLGDYLSQQQPELVLVSLTATPRPHLETLLAECPRLGYREIDARRLPAGCRKRVTILARSPWVARRPDGWGEGEQRRRGMGER